MKTTPYKSCGSCRSPIDKDNRWAGHCSECGMRLCEFCYDPVVKLCEDCAAEESLRERAESEEDCRS